MPIIGLTGGFGTGKTFVASIFKRLGAKVIDADKLAHRAFKKGTPTYEKVIARFGDKVLGKGQAIDRQALAAIVFNDKKSLAALNRIVHPEVIGRIQKEIARASKGDVIIIDAPLIVEVGLLKLVETLVVVKTSREHQLKRCMQKFNIKKEDILRRTHCQIPLEKKIVLADYVIDNDGTKQETRKQAQAVWEKISHGVYRKRQEARPRGTRARGCMYGNS